MKAVPLENWQSHHSLGSPGGGDEHQRHQDKQHFRRPASTRKQRMGETPSSIQLATVVSVQSP